MSRDLIVHSIQMLYIDRWLFISITYTVYLLYVRLMNRFPLLPEPGGNARVVQLGMCVCRARNSKTIATIYLMFLHKKYIRDFSLL